MGGMEYTDTEPPEINQETLHNGTINWDVQLLVPPGDGEQVLGVSCGREMEQNACIHRVIKICRRHGSHQAVS